VLVLDEAHLLDTRQLEAIRLRTNHDLDSESPFAAGRSIVGENAARIAISETATD